MNESNPGIPICVPGPRFSIKDINDRYVYDFRCTNCSVENTRFILKGKRLSDCHVVCSNCGCDANNLFRKLSDP